jgi:hypothetical protein
LAQLPQTAPATPQLFGVCCEVGTQTPPAQHPLTQVAALQGPPLHTPA